MARTPWRKIVDRFSWYVEHSLHFPVCFELGVGPATDRSEPVVVFVGAAANEARMLTALEAGGHPLSPRIVAELQKDHAVFVRSTGAPTLEQAEALAAESRAGVDYPWNEPAT